MSVDSESAWDVQGSVFLVNVDCTLGCSLIPTTMPVTVLTTAQYANVVLLDSMVVLEAKPLEHLPWSELFTGSILLLVCRQVETEIDQKKQDGRLGVRARAANRLLDSFLETASPVRVCSPPDVDIALVTNGRVDWSKHDDLDPANGDDCIVAQALNARVDDPSRIVILSYDMRPRHAATTNGLKAVKLPESWLRDREQSPHEKRINELEKKVLLLSADQPELVVTIEVSSPRPWQYRDVSEPSPEQIAELRESHRGVSERPALDRFSAFTPELDYSFNERFARWKNTTDRNLPLIHRGLSRYLSQQRVRICLKNVGVISAENVELKIASGNSLIHSMPFFVLATGGSAPTPRPAHWNSLSYLGKSLNQPREQFEFYCDEQGPGRQVVYSCALFRHEKRFEIEVTIELLRGSSPKTHVEVNASATNMKARAHAAATVDVLIAETPFIDAFDFAGRRPRVPSHFDMSLKASKRYRYFQNDGSEYEADG